MEVAEFLDQVARTAEERMYAFDAELQMYDHVSCKADREKVKQILKGQLDYYSCTPVASVNVDANVAYVIDVVGGSVLFSRL